MKTMNWALGLGVAGLLLVGCNKGGDGDLKTSKEKASYLIGQNIGSSFKQQGLDSGAVDLDKLHKGIKDALAGVKPTMSEKEISEIMMAFQQTIMKRADSLRVLKATENFKAGREFLDKNAKESGVVTLPSGLQYKVLTKGNGKIPTASSTVTVHYVGTLTDGTEFDSSRKRGEPATFPVTGVIAGWTEALQLMPAGSKWKLFIPANLAYGEQGSGPTIGPNAVLIFEVELLSVSEDGQASESR
jgi:FKBP-type peptidyl-prolyl cis-trans isomerase FklB